MPGITVDDDFQAEMDLRTLEEAKKIKASTERMSKAEARAEAQLRAVSGEKEDSNTQIVKQGFRRIPT